MYEALKTSQEIGRENPFNKVHGKQGKIEEDRDRRNYTMPREYKKINKLLYFVRGTRRESVSRDVLKQFKLTYNSWV